MRLSMTFVFLAGVLFCAWVAWAASDQESNQRQVCEEQQQMIDAAVKASEAVTVLYDIGAGGVTLEGVYTWSRRWADAQGDGAPKGEQVKAYMAHRDRMKKLFDKVKRRHDDGVVGGEKPRYEAAQYYAAEATYLLLKMTSNSK